MSDILMAQARVERESLLFDGSRIPRRIQMRSERYQALLPSFCAWVSWVHLVWSERTPKKIGNLNSARLGPESNGWDLW
jgi:hypothetical protein